MRTECEKHFNVHQCAHMQTNLFNLCAECSDATTYDSAPLGPCHDEFEATHHHHHKSLEQQQRDVRLLTACYEEALRQRCLLKHLEHDVVEPEEVKQHRRVEAARRQEIDKLQENWKDEM